MQEELTLEEFTDINESELNCIFAESGIDRELEFSHENETEELYFSDKYSHLIRTRNEYDKELKSREKRMIDFETDEMISMAYSQQEIDEHINWKFNS